LFVDPPSESGAVVAVAEVDGTEVALADALDVDVADGVEVWV
jgi:hypothetical protein